jgi:RepB DNA-primase from phage plasmid
MRHELVDHHARPGHRGVRKTSSGDCATQAAAFLTRVWRLHSSGYVFLATRRVSGRCWEDHALKLPVRHHELKRLLRAYPRTLYDHYFCPNAFSKPKRKRKYTLPTPYGWCDIDDGDPLAFRPPPNFLWRTSPAHHQGIWIWDRFEEPDQAEAYSKALAYRFGGDRNGWSVTKYLRVPWTYNHKPEYDRPLVKLIADGTGKPQSQRPRLLRGVSHAAALDLRVDPSRHDPREVLEKYCRKLHLRVRWLIRTRRVSEGDRSKCIFEIIAGLHKAGASPDEIAAVVLHNPYFISKHGRRRDHLNAEISRILSKLGARHDH